MFWLGEQLKISYEKVEYKGVGVKSPFKLKQQQRNMS
jgi:hypothetical protein